MRDFHMLTNDAETDIWSLTYGFCDYNEKYNLIPTIEEFMFRYSNAELLLLQHFLLNFDRYYNTEVDIDGKQTNTKQSSKKSK